MTEEKKHILAAEDNFVNQKLLEKIFQTENWDITLVSNGNQAIEEAKTNRYSLVLMDIRMPDIDGFEATKKIREFNPEIPIIAITANAMLGFKEQCLSAGMNDFITKPFKKEELFEVIRQHLSK